MKVMYFVSINHCMKNGKFEFIYPEHNFICDNLDQVILGVETFVSYNGMDTGKLDFPDYNSPLTSGYINYDDEDGHHQLGTYTIARYYGVEK